MGFGDMIYCSYNKEPQKPIEIIKAPTRILSGPFIIRVPFFLIFSFNKGTLNQKGQKGTTQEPSLH